MKCMGAFANLFQKRLVYLVSLLIYCFLWVVINEPYPNINGVLTDWGRKKIAAISQTLLRHILLNENGCMSITILLKFAPKGQIRNFPALVQINYCRRPGDKT